jgi:ELWxxDGT repeat protein
MRLPWGKDQSNPIYLTELNGQLYFSADDGADGYELWKSDGTEAGTVMVEDLFPGTYYDQKTQAIRAYSSYPGPFTKFNGELYFPADDGTDGFELWKTDGTKDGTVLVKDIAPGAFDGLPYGGLYSFLTPIGGELYFAADDGDHGSELWKTDGTEAGTVLVKDIVPGSFGSEPYNLVNMNGILFFDAFQDNTGNDELFKSDGTAAGTVLVADINPGSSGSYLHDPTLVNGILYFAANDGTHGKELWRSDGTAAGTQLVADLNAGLTGSQLSYLTNLNGTLFFAANDGNLGSELWRTDGTASGTVLVKDIDPGSAGSNVKGIVNVNGTLYFSASDGTHGNELWKSDGTAAGTVLVQDLNQRSVDSNPANFTVLGNSLLFSADDGFHGTELWKLSTSAGGGSSSGTAQLASAAVQTPLNSPADSASLAASDSPGTPFSRVQLTDSGALRKHRLARVEGENSAWSFDRSQPSLVSAQMTPSTVAVEVINGGDRSTFVGANSKSGTVDPVIDSIIHVTDSSSLSKLLATGGGSPSESTTMGDRTLNSPTSHKTVAPVRPVTTTNLCGLRPTAVDQVLSATALNRNRHSLHAKPVTADNNVLEDLFASHSS